jgi:hypothetical protein
MRSGLPDRRTGLSLLTIRAEAIKYSVNVYRLRCSFQTVRRIGGQTVRRIDGQTVPLLTVKPSHLLTFPDESLWKIKT